MKAFEKKFPKPEPLKDCCENCIHRDDSSSEYCGSCDSLVSQFSPNEYPVDDWQHKQTGWKAALQEVVAQWEGNMDIKTPDDLMRWIQKELADA